MNFENAPGLKEALENSEGNPFNKGGKEAHFQERFATQQRLLELQEARRIAERQDSVESLHMADDVPEEKPNGIYFQISSFFPCDSRKKPSL